MSGAAPESAVAQLNAKVDEVIFALKGLLALALVVLSVPNLCVSLSISKFQEIFQDALPGKPLPLLTLSIIHHPLLHHIVVLLLPMAGIIVLAQKRRIRTCTIVTAVLVCVIGAQLFLTWLALFLPIVGLETGMSNGP
jgi:hypothetical protein